MYYQSKILNQLLGKHKIDTSWPVLTSLIFIAGSLGCSSAVFFILPGTEIGSTLAGPDLQVRINSCHIFECVCKLLNRILIVLDYAQ